MFSEKKLFVEIGVCVSFFLVLGSIECIFGRSRDSMVLAGLHTCDADAFTPVFRV